MARVPDVFDYDDEQEHPEGEARTCERCSQDGLWWVHTGQRWRLMEGNNPHACKATADDFDVVP